MGPFKATAVLLAAGLSQRFGADKRLHPLGNGEAMAVSVAKQLLSVCDQVIAVVRIDSDALVAPLQSLGVACVPCARAREGMGFSLATGVEFAASVGSDAVLLALADMPYVKLDTYKALLNALRGKASIVAPSFNGQRGNPVGFSADWFDELMRCRGDEGARKLLKAHEACVVHVPVCDAGIHQDIDRPDDFARFSVAVVPTWGPSSC